MQLPAFQFSVITDEIDQDAERALDVCRELGLPGVELRTVWGKNLLSLSASEVAELRRLIAERGLQVVSIASPVFKAALEPSKGGAQEGEPAAAVPDFQVGSAFGWKSGESPEEQEQALLHAFELAHEFGTRLVRVFAFWREGPFTGSVLDRIVERFQRPVALAQEAGMTLGLENEAACYVADGFEADAFFRRVQEPIVGLVWDPGNSLMFGNDRPFPDEYRLVKERIVHMHLKDVTMREGKREWAPLGSGLLDLEGQLLALAEDGYTGWISIETHYRGPGLTAEASTRETVAGLDRALARIGLRRSA